MRVCCYKFELQQTLPTETSVAWVHSECNGDFSRGKSILQYPAVIPLCPAGVGVNPGSVVVTSAPVNGELKEEHVQFIAGKKVPSPTVSMTTVIHLTVTLLRCPARPVWTSVFSRI